MDPYLNNPKLFEVLVTIVVFIERALSIIFESSWFINIYDKNGQRKGITETRLLTILNLLKGFGGNNIYIIN